MNISELLIEFRATQDKRLLNISEDVNLEDLNVITIDILSWLKLEHKRELWIAEGKRTRLKCFKLSENIPWCDLLRKLVETDTIFSKCFMISEDGLVFRPEINEKTRSEIRLRAYELYNPPMIT